MVFERQPRTIVGGVDDVGILDEFQLVEDIEQASTQARQAVQSTKDAGAKLGETCARLDALVAELA